jgi:hypothetical protein
MILDVGKCSLGVKKYGGKISTLAVLGSKSIWDESIMYPIVPSSCIFVLSTLLYLSHPGVLSILTWMYSDLNFWEFIKSSFLVNYVF